MTSFSSILTLAILGLLCTSIYAQVPNQQNERGCLSSDVSFDLEVPPNIQCGGWITAYLRNKGNCTINTGGALICDANLVNCGHCQVDSKTPDGWKLLCKAIGFDGVQVITDTYILGPLYGTIANATRVSCATPSVTPQTIIPHTPVACDSNTVYLSLEEPLPCGGPFTAKLKTTTDCNFSSGGALLCDGIGRNCVSCLAHPTPGDPRTLTYNCISQNIPGQQLMTATYQLGPYIGTAAIAHDFGCPAN